MPTPNIFDYATGELSQDAFLAWIARWADPQFEASDANLNAVAKDFLFFLCAAVFSTSDIVSVSPILQYKKTDVLIDIELTNGDKHLLLIEDKTGTHHHGGQLARYISEISKQIAPDGEFPSRILHPVYYKTQDHLTYDLGAFKNIGRLDVLQIFESPKARKIKNQIFIDYVSRLRRMEDNSRAYKDKKWEDWEYDQWSGFMLDLCREIGEPSNFGYVPNASGGFIGAWFGWMDSKYLADGEDLYFQMGAVPKKNFDLTIRVSSAEKSRTVELARLIAPELETALDIKGIGYSTRYRQAGKSMRLLSFTDLDIDGEREKVSPLVSTIRNLILVMTR